MLTLGRLDTITVTTIKDSSNCDVSQVRGVGEKSSEVHLGFLEMHSGTTYYFHYFLYFTANCVASSSPFTESHNHTLCFCSPCYNQLPLVRICASMCSSEPRSVSFRSLRLSYHVPIREDCECGRTTVLWSENLHLTMTLNIKGVYVKCILVERKHL